MTCLLFTGKGCVNHRSVLDTKACLLHDKLKLILILNTILASLQVAQTGVIPSDNLLVRGLTAYLIIYYTITCHIYTHICRRLVRALSQDLFKNSIQYREYLHITVIVNSGNSVILQMEGINHVDIVKISRRCLICHIDRMLKRQVPDREGLELGVSGLNASLMLMIEL